MGAGFCQQSLFQEKFVCAVRRDHPRIGSALSLEQFENETHLAVATTGTGHGILQRTMEAKGIERKVGLTVPSFLGLVSILMATDYVAILPGRLAKHLASAGYVKMLRMPFQMPSYVIMQHWHERYTNAPAVRWLRSVIAELFSEQVNPSRRAELVAGERTSLAAQAVERQTAENLAL